MRAHAQCHIYYIQHVEFHFRFEHHIHACARIQKRQYLNAKTTIVKLYLCIYSTCTIQPLRHFCSERQRRTRRTCQKNLEIWPWKPISMVEHNYTVFLILEYWNRVEILELQTKYKSRQIRYCIARSQTARNFRHHFLHQKPYKFNKYLRWPEIVF